jgi:hypothetical protein
MAKVVHLRARSSSGNDELKLGHEGVKPLADRLRPDWSPPLNENRGAEAGSIVIFSYHFQTPVIELTLRRQADGRLYLLLSDSTVINRPRLAYDNEYDR